MARGRPSRQGDESIVSDSEILLPEGVADESAETSDEETPYPNAIKVIEYNKLLTEHRRVITATKDNLAHDALLNVDPVAEEIADFHDDYSETHIVEPPQVLVDNKGAVHIVCIASRHDVALSLATSKATIGGQSQAIGQIALHSVQESAGGPRSAVEVAGAAALPHMPAPKKGGLGGLFGR